ncbi:MAG: VOC family protein [Deltaproteobacteria bacterium]|nr:VOC family protein [Deltaproteobacteria bacterium]MBI3295129.1 VOC family protein [Deltaproteobacteria bacterium]
MKEVMTGAYGTMYYVRDMKKSCDYYKMTFGLSPRFESPEWTEFNVGGHGLCLHAMAPDFKSTSEVGVLICQVTGIRPLVESLTQQGVEFMGPVREVHPGAFSVDFKDPSGNVLSLYEDTNRR